MRAHAPTRATLDAPEANSGAAAEWTRFHLFVPPLSVIGLRVIQNATSCDSGEVSFRIPSAAPRAAPSDPARTRH
jgi:hypothetical protein